MLLLESSVEIAHKIYVDNMKRLGKDNEKLRGWLSEANTQSRESNRIIIKQVKNKESHRVSRRRKERFTAYESRSNLNKSAYIVEGRKWQLIRVLKTISKNWKLLMYLKNKNIMKTVIKNGLERGMVWSFRRFKEPIRSKQEEKSKTESEQESLDTPYQENDLETLPQKNFLELGGIKKVVDTINQFRKRLEVNEEKTVTGSQLKKDNATTDEVRYVASPLLDPERLKVVQKSRCWKLFLRRQEKKWNGKRLKRKFLGKLETYKSKKQWL
ncbi:hypothetical protein GLOIN_2v1767536 [Rhizophagus irregularis DAOM 181602=DAOM 197198]|nr:hypothetical protein GLOIN_2v1767536 [Rhizophagus irregularis DAOM 181602=DAOM 197198]